MAPTPTPTAEPGRAPARRKRVLSFIVIGEAAVGKTALITRFSGEPVLPDYLATILIDFKTRNVEIDGEQLKLTIWDTAGQERFSSIISSYYRRAQGIMLVYDIADRASFDKISNYWIKVLLENTDGGAARILVGNKTDLDGRGYDDATQSFVERRRVVSYDDGRMLARKLDALFYETSAFNNINVDDAFLDLAVAVKRHLDGVVNAQNTVNTAVRRVLDAGAGAASASADDLPMAAPRTDEPEAPTKRCCVLS